MVNSIGILSTFLFFLIPIPCISFSTELYTTFTVKRTLDTTNRDKILEVDGYLRYTIPRKDLTIIRLLSWRNSLTIVLLMIPRILRLFILYNHLHRSAPTWTCAGIEVNQTVQFSTSVHGISKLCCRCFFLINLIS